MNKKYSTDRNNGIYSTKDILNHFIDNDFKEMKDEFAKIITFINNQIAINIGFANCKLECDKKKLKDEENKIKVIWYKREWIKTLIIMVVTLILYKLADFILK